MARRKQGREEIPAQDRYPTERDSNMMQYVNVIPLEEINSNTKFPMPKPGCPGNESISYGEKDSEFITPSHTNGKK